MGIGVWRQWEYVEDGAWVMGIGLPQDQRFPLEGSLGRGTALEGPGHGCLVVSMFFYRFFAAGGTRSSARTRDGTRTHIYTLVCCVGHFLSFALRSFPSSSVGTVDRRATSRDKDTGREGRDDDDNDVLYANAPTRKSNHLPTNLAYLLVIETRDLPLVLDPV